MTEAAKIHLDLLQNHRLSILCGAGISRNSGIPSVAPFLCYFFEKLGAEKEDIKSYLGTDFPFEATMENVRERLLEGLDELLQIFNIRNPNNNHRLMAKLAAVGKLRTIITTNFDQNIELALEDEGLVIGKDFVVIKSFENFNINDYPNSILVIKLHGSIEDLPSVVTTISRVAKDENISLMKQVMEQLLHSGRFDSLVTWGYSFSDRYDITPALEKLPATNIALYIHHQTGKSEPEYRRPAGKEQKFSPFTNPQYLGFGLDDVVFELEQTLANSRSQAVQMSDWHAFLDQWMSRIMTGKDFNNRLGLLTYLFNQAGHHSIAVKYAEQGLNSTDPDDLVLRGDLLSQIGKSLMEDPNNRQHEKAIPYFEEAVGIYKKIDRGGDYATHMANLGTCYYAAGKLREAESAYLASIQYHTPGINSTDRDRAHYSFKDSYGAKLNLSFIRRDQGNFPEAILLLKEVKDAASKAGNYELQELATTALGDIYRRLGNYPQALAELRAGFVMAKTYGKPARIKSTFIKVFQASLRSGGWAAANDFKNAEFKSVSDKTGLTEGELVRVISSS